MKKYRYEVTIPSAGTTSVVHAGEFEEEDMFSAGLQIVDLFDDIETATEVKIKLIE